MRYDFSCFIYCLSNHLITYNTQGWWGYGKIRIFMHFNAYKLLHFVRQYDSIHHIWKYFCFLIEKYYLKGLLYWSFYTAKCKDHPDSLVIFLFLVLKSPYSRIHLLGCPPSSFWVLWVRWLRHILLDESITPWFLEYFASINFFLLPYYYSLVYDFSEPNPLPSTSKTTCLALKLSCWTMTSSWINRRSSIHLKPSSEINHCDAWGGYVPSAFSYYETPGINMFNHYISHILKCRIFSSFSIPRITTCLKIHGVL